MSENKLFGEQFNRQDQNINENRLLSKWSPLENDMKQQQEQDNKSQRQQKEKSNPQSQQGLAKKEWSQEQENLVYKLHNEYGNKWAIIADHLKGRTDNCIKNHFYSRLRKGLRKINKVIEDQFKKTYKQFKIIDLYKVIEASDQKFKQVKNFTNQMSDIGHDLKNRLFIYAEQQDEKTEEYKKRVMSLLQDLSQFTKNYKRKSKKSRRYSPMGVDSVYRVNSKKSTVLTQTNQQEINKNNSAQKEKPKSAPMIKIEAVSAPIKIEEESERIPIKTRQKRENVKVASPQKQIPTINILKKEYIQENEQMIPKKNLRHKSRDYRNFSDDEDEQKNEVEYLKQQRLNHFAENILKTFKSYYSFQSFKSNSVMEEPFFP